MDGYGPRYRSVSSGVFWTKALQADVVEVDLEDGEATLRVHGLDVGHTATPVQAVRSTALNSSGRLTQAK
jgi:hypothetical protein